MSDATARWKGLVLDAADTDVAMGFWGPVLGLTGEHTGGPDGVMRGGASERTVWVNAVPEPKTVKNRVHLDLVADDIDAYVRLGARVAPGYAAAQEWSVLQDPEGNEFCVFPPGPARPSAIVVDSPRPEEIAAWWADVLGAEASAAPDGTRRWLTHVDGLPWDTWKFVGVDDPKVVKNRWHWDVTAPALEPLLERGASVVRAQDDEIRWHVLADPDGNEFCVFLP
ncbi:VOC family protein [Motilibacter rhizosphaerae]|nr:VOC family protein [Motilibacter rhizosphaerae]